MGRRALRKIDPSLDLSRHLKILDDLSSPFDASDYFQRPAPLEIEVGSGKGLFLSTASASVPDHHFIGIEISRKYARFAAARLAKADAANALMIQGDALRFFQEHLVERSVAAVHVYFPDPWWKARHKKRRVMNESFVRDIERVLAAHGRLHFWTDVEEYFETTLELIGQVSSLKAPKSVAESPANHDLDYRTHFERRMRMHDLPVYRAEFVRTS